MMDILLSLVCSALYGARPEEWAVKRLQALSEREWNALLELAERQTVSGLVYRALEMLKDEVHISEDCAFRLVGRLSSTVIRHKQFREAENGVLALFEGLHPVVMKGSTCAARYPDPALREAGDIDLFLAGDAFDGAVALLEQSGMAYTCSPDGSVVSLYRDCVVELHRRYYDLHVREDLLPVVPSAEAELVMLSAHILKHACGTGVGLRQICDYALAWQAYEGDRGALEQLFSRLGLRKWHRLLTEFVADCLALSGPSGRPNPLLRIVEYGGNFGLHAPGRKDSLERSALARKASTARIYLSRLPFSLRYAPRETLATIRELIKGNL